MVKIGAALLGLVAASGSYGAKWTVCVEDPQSLLSTPLQAAMLREFHTLMGGRISRLRFAGCDGMPLRIALKVKQAPSTVLDGVLGLARIRSAHVEPRLEIYYQPMLRYLGNPNSSEAIGRALARVAAHETEHFLAQQVQHCRAGLLRSRFPAPELLAASPEPFRLCGRCRAHRRRSEREAVGFSQGPNRNRQSASGISTAGSAER